MTRDQLKELIRDVPDYPRKGIVFKDLTPLMASGAAFGVANELLSERVGSHRPDVVVGIESRGFIFAAAAAVRLGIGFVPVRKPGKLPWKKQRVEYALEYGTDALEMHEDAVLPGQRVVVIDDLLATGGTAAATVKLVQAQGAQVVGLAFLVELAFLGGRGQLGPVPVDALIVF